MNLTDIRRELNNHKNRFKIDQAVIFMNDTFDYHERRRKEDTQPQSERGHGHEREWRIHQIKGVVRNRNKGT